MHAVEPVVTTYSILYTCKLVSDHDYPLNFSPPPAAVLNWELDENEGSITINVQATSIDFSRLDCTRFTIINET